MKELLSLLAIASLASGMQYNGLRVKFGWSDALANKEYFHKIPRTLVQAESEGWRRTERPKGPLEELRLYCSPGKYVCPLYDPSGFVAGIQLAFPADELVTPTFKPEKWFKKWTVPASDGEPAKDYMTITQYFVSEESLAAGAGPQMENGATLQDGGVWVNDPDGQLMRIPSTEAELNTTLFKKQNCVPNMGTHYYYNMSRDTLCENILPWFAITTKGYLVGVGLQFFGKLTESPKEKEWFELFEGRMIAESTIPLAPECLYRSADTYPVFGLHIYYIDDPWNIKCRAGDSIKTADLMSRLMINLDRYSTSLMDNVKKIFIVNKT
ncbi:uncharacterized protein LOC120632271 [Pararge aegeria]|uniref:uncharacterized protein LOC120632271 n=1 Tax=Pararge aegeria TaxID=116150 RepID=UPI0019D2C37B|nr:uncharacterized protein LOC120632271 [Pararge aegeria]